MSTNPFEAEQAFQRPFSADRGLFRAMACRLAVFSLLSCLVAPLASVAQEPAPFLAAEPVLIAQALPETHDPATTSNDQVSIGTDNLLADRPISAVRATLAHSPGERPGNAAAGTLRRAGALPQPSGLGRSWLTMQTCWEPAATKHLPLYFEEPNLERIGYRYRCKHNPADWICDPCADHHEIELIQPLVSAGHFFGRIAFLPYMMGADHPDEPIYTLGVDRPGSPTPYRKHLVPLSGEGALYQAGAITGAAFLIP